MALLIRPRPCLLAVRARGVRVGMQLDGGCGCAGSSAMPHIWRAAQTGDLAEVERLVGRDAGLIDAKDGVHGVTPLILASWEGHVGLVQWLMDKGAAMDERSALGQSALFLASFHHDERSPVVRLLLEKGADPTIVTNLGWTPVVAASYRGHLEVVRLLLGHPSAKSTTNFRTTRGMTALWFACWSGRGGWRGCCWRTGPIQRSLTATASPPWPSPSLT
jgi:hypothetical protein